MTKRRLNCKKQKLPSRSQSINTVVAEVSLGEARKHLFEAQCLLHERKPVLQLHSKIFGENEDRLGPWYFTHV